MKIIVTAFRGVPRCSENRQWRGGMSSQRATLRYDVTENVGDVFVDFLLRAHADDLQAFLTRLCMVDACLMTKLFFDTLSLYITFMAIKISYFNNALFI